MIRPILGINWQYQLKPCHKSFYFESPAAGDSERHMPAKTVEIFLSVIPEIYGHIHYALFVCRPHLKYFREFFLRFPVKCLSACKICSFVFRLGEMV